VLHVAVIVDQYIQENDHLLHYCLTLRQNSILVLTIIEIILIIVLIKCLYLYEICNVDPLQTQTGETTKYPLREKKLMVQ
jgi:hypothetical protein